MKQLNSIFKLKCAVNGSKMEREIPSSRSLLEFIREDLGLKGTKEGCGEGECGACMVLVDGKAVNSCLMMAVQLHGKELVTIEGIKGRDGGLHPLQKTFMAEGAVQCGFCTPGLIIASEALLRRKPKATLEDIKLELTGNLCRCTGYEKILSAVGKAKNKIFFTLLLAVFALAPPGSFGAPDKTLVSAREAILSLSVAPQAALVKYVAAAKKTISAPVAPEYAYALAYAGLPEAALYNIDRALIAGPLNPEIRFYLSEIFNAFGLEGASSGLSTPLPTWLKASPLKLPALDMAAPAGDFDTVFVFLNLLMTQKRYAQAAVQYDRLCKVFPGEARCRVGYALALERLGAYKAAAAEAKKNLDIFKGPDQRRITEAFIDDLSKRQPLKLATGEKPSLKGRYLLFTGGSLSRSDDRTLYSFNGRIGRFISERVDISASAAINGGNEVDDYNGLGLGVAARYNTPLSFVPLNLTLAAKAERVPAPGKNLSFLLSPGLSYFIRDSSIDLIPLKNPCI